MRELSLNDTMALGLLLLLSLVLPMLMSLAGPQNGAARKACRRWVWSGQILIAAAGVMILFSSALSLVGLALGTIGCASCAVLFAQARRAGQLSK